MILLVFFSAMGVVGLRYANLSLLEQRLVHISDLPDSVVSAGFALTSDRELQIYLHGATQVRQRRGGSGLVTASIENVWVIDAGTKETIWNMREVPVDRGPEGALVYQGTIALPAGQYVLYCSVQTAPQRNSNDSWVSWLEADREHQASGTDSDDRSMAFHVTVSGRGKRLTDTEVVAALDAPPVESSPRVANEPATQAVPVGVRNTRSRTGRTDDVLANLTRLEDDEARFAHFTLSRRTEVRVYAVGEGMEGEMYDYGWIVNTSNGRTVWEMKYRDTQHAGGDGKNRFVDETISLGHGKYVVYFVTDDSHSYEDWNARRPFDEEAWGIRVVEAGTSIDSERGRVDESVRWIPIAQLTGIRDDVRRRRHFTLDSRTWVRVYALGEGDRNEMYDRAWIEDADSRETIWEMRYRNSEHAGGASKNRLVDTTGWLPAGEYVLRYRSDDSHSPESWNAEPPDDARNYGVTVFAEYRNR